MYKRTCCIEACSNKHLARGYCGTHYQQLVVGEAKRHPKVLRDCVVCGVQVERRLDSKYASTCSVRCRNVVQWGSHCAPSGAYTWRADALNRAKKYGVAIVDDFDRIVIFERDDWVCWVCNVRCTTPDPYTLTAATIDHVQPLSRGGDHSIANAATCCLSCNSRRQAGALVVSTPRGVSRSSHEAHGDRGGGQLTQSQPR